MRTTPIDPDVPPIVTVPDVLSESECSGLVRRADALGFELASIAYRRGLAALFQHALLHEAKPVQQGVKHVLRNDVLYPR